MNDSSLVITANIPQALQLQQARIIAATDLFPEWSRLLLSALLVRSQNLAEANMCGLVEKIVYALNKACRAIHFSPRNELPYILMELYKDAMGDNHDLAKRVSDVLLVNRFIPENVMLSELGHLCNCALWNFKLADGVFFRKEEMRERVISANIALHGESEYTRALYERFLHSEITTIYRKTGREVVLMHKAMLSIDMVGYSGLARMLEENTSTETVAELNKQIQSFIDQGLKAVKLAREETVMATTGDGAILAFDKSEHMHRFAEAFYEATWQHNVGKTEASAKRWFRMGAASGDITMEARPNGGYDVAGVTIANAVRLEAASRPSELLIDIGAYNALPADLHGRYQAEEQIRGKRDEIFTARRCVMLGEDAQGKRPPKPPELRRASGNLRDILEMWPKLPEDYLAFLVMAINMPISLRPPEQLNYAQKFSRVVAWSESVHGGLEDLESQLRYLLDKIMF